MLPAGPTAQRAYAALSCGLNQTKKWALGRGPFSGRYSPVVIRPWQNQLAVELLHDPGHCKAATEATTVPVSLTPEEIALSTAFIDATTRVIHWPEYRDDFAEQCASLIDAKLQERPLPARPPAHVVVLPLLEALRQSLAPHQRARKVRPLRLVRGRAR